MSTLLIANLTTRTAVFEGEAWAPDPFVFGEDIPLAVRLTKTVGGVEEEFGDDVLKLRAFLGEQDARPESGKWALQAGDGAQTEANTTAALQATCSPSALQEAINAKTEITAAYGTARVTAVDGSLVIVFGEGEEQVPLKVRDNKLFPISFGRISAYTVDGVWQHEVRLTRLPVATVKKGSEGEPAVQRKLPPAPTIKRIYGGQTVGEVSQNEVQALTIPPQFNGAYVLRVGGVRTVEITQDDDAAAIQQALETLLGTGNVKVTEQANFRVFIEYTGELAAEAQDLPTVEVIEPPQGDLTFSIPLKSASLFTLLKRSAVVTLPLEVWLQTKDEDDQVSDRVAFRAAIQVARPVGWDDLDTLEEIDWTRPFSPVDYRHYDPSTVLTGQQYYPAELGDGEATVFTIDHGLNTRIVRVWVAENTDNGLQLVEGTDYRVRIVDANSVTVTSLVGAPEADAWIAVVMSAQSVAAFANGLTINIDQVNGLQEQLDSLSDRVSDLEDAFPTKTPSRSDSTSKVELTLPTRTEIFPGLFPSGFDYASAIKSGAGLRAAPILLQAVHGSAAPGISTVLAGGELPAASTQARKVFTNDTAAAIVLPAGSGRPATSVPVGAYIASDGRVWYRVSHDGATTSYFPTEYERELFRLAVSEKLLREGKRLELGFALTTAMLKANCKGMIGLRLQAGVFAKQDTPATTAPNLRQITWNNTAMLSADIQLTPSPQTAVFGLSIARDEEGEFSAEQLLFNAWEAAGAVPAAANFAIRGLLVNFDTDDLTGSPRGFVYTDFKPQAIELK